MRRLGTFTLALAAAGLMAMHSPARGQSPGGPAALLLRQGERLELTDEQVKQLETIRERQAEMFARQDSARRAARDEALAVLTPEQKAQVESLGKRHHRRGHPRRGHSHARTDSLPG